jgi:hypothetical protein
MKLALLPPPKNAEWMLETNYQLLLPSHFGIGNYNEVVAQCAERGDYIILDNGAAEGLPIDDAEDLYDVARKYRATEVVIPDVYGDMQGTLEKFKGWAFNESFKHMAVVAAQNVDEALTLIDAYLNEPLVDTIGLPRLLLETCNASIRYYLVGYLSDHMETTGVEVHLLGTYPGFMNELHGLEVFANAGVRGIDTSAPFVYGLQCLRWPKDLDAERARKSNYHDLNMSTVGQLPLDYITNNVRWLREAVYGQETPTRGL